MNIVDAAMLVALEAHAGQINSHDGEPYILHLARVYVNVKEAGGDEVCQAVAWLHDTVEDTELSAHDLFDELMAIPVNPTAALEVEINVDVLSKKPGESNVTYYNRVKTFPIARFVKLNGDIKDNFRRNHQIKDEATRLRMAAKYSLGTDILS